MARSGARARLVLLDAVIARNGGSALHLDALAQTPPRTVGFAAAVSTAPLPQGPTAFAAAIAASLIPPDVELGALLHAIQARLNGGATSLTIAVPPGSFWVAGGPPQPAEPPAPVPAPPVPAPPAPAPPAPAVPAVVAPVVTMPDEDHMTEADRRRIQSALLRLGYYDRQVDGVFGADTRAAIRRFQHEIGAPMTGRITPEQSGRLLADPR